MRVDYSYTIVDDDGAVVKTAEGSLDNEADLLRSLHELSGLFRLALQEDAHAKRQAERQAGKEQEERGSGPGRATVWTDEKPA